MSFSRWGRCLSAPVLGLQYPSCGQVNRLIDGLDGERLPTINLAHVDLAGGEQRPEQHGCGLCGRQHGLVLATSAFILACGAMPVRAQEPMMQQPPNLQLQQEMERARASTLRAEGLRMIDIKMTTPAMAW